MTQKHEREALDDLARLETCIGYTFADRGLLVRALTHSSYSNELGEKNHHLLCNERLEFLGDSVLSLVVSNYLFHTYRQEAEGVLTCMRKDVVCAKALAGYARQIELGRYLRLGIGEARNHGRDKENILADAFEALLAALYLDAKESGMATVESFLLPFIQKDLDELAKRGMDSDYKTLLQQFIQQTGEGVLEYVKVEESGPDHMKRFVMEARMNSMVIGRGEGSSIRRAEQAAAKAALDLFDPKKSE